MNLTIFISLLTIFIIILIFLFLFLFYYIWNNKLKEQLKTTKEILMINKQFWHSIPNDFLYCLYKRIPNIDKNELNNTKNVIKSLKISLDESCSLSEKLVYNLNKLNFLYLKKSLNKIINSRNSIISTSILIIKNIQNNLVFLENKNKELIQQHKNKQLLNTYCYTNNDDLLDFLIRQEAINFIFFSIDIFLKNNEYKNYKHFFKNEVEKLFNEKNNEEIQSKINQYISFLNKGIPNNKLNLIQDFEHNLLNINEINLFFLNRSINLINMFVNSKNEFNVEFQEIFNKARQCKNKISASNLFWINFRNKINKI